jgi:hypothetical protein
MRLSVNSKFSKVLVAVALTTAIVGAMSQTASADEAVPNPQLLKSWPHGVCLDSDYGSVYAGGCNGGDYQKFHLDNAQIGVRIRDHATNWCLQSTEGGQVDEIFSTECNDDQHQMWVLRQGVRDDGRIVQSFQNVWTQYSLAIVDTGHGFDVQAIQDNKSDDTLFAVSP